MTTAAAAPALHHRHLAPSRSYTEEGEDGESHSLDIDASGSDPSVVRHSETKKVKDIAEGDTFSLAEQIEASTTTYLSPETPEEERTALLDSIRENMTKLKGWMAAARGDASQRAQLP